MTSCATREGSVQQTNGTGFKLDGQWVNLSKFAKPEDVPMPVTGSTVRVHLDPKGFVRKVETLATPEPAPARSTPTGRDGVVTRLAVLNTATAILGSGNRPVDPVDVVRLAGQLETWATR